MQSARFAVALPPALNETWKSKLKSDPRELCARPAADDASRRCSQHLDVLEAANLVTTVRQGREKLHYLNPVPLHQIYERWIRKFERRRLRALHDLRVRVEGEADG